MYECFGATIVLGTPLISSLLYILTQLAYIGNGEKSCFILQQIHWAETHNVI